MEPILKTSLKLKPAAVSLENLLQLVLLKTTGRFCDSDINNGRLVVGIPILSCEMPQRIQEKAKPAESALDESIPKSCRERTQCRSSI